MTELLERILDGAKKSGPEGRKAAYIPALRKAPEKMGIALRTADRLYTAGDGEHRFTFQSMSKIIILLLALEDNGEARVFRRVGMEPSGESFNSISKLDFSSVKKPFNPFINSGALVTTSLIKGRSAEEKQEKAALLCRRIFGRQDIGFNREVYASEKSHSDRNRALVYLLKEKGLLKGKIDEILDLYFRLCSLEVSCIDLAGLGHFLAFPAADSPVQEAHLRICKTLMLCCGMYDYSGEFALRVGIPSKSGVSGGIVSTVPGKMGLGVFSPGLDAKGNSLAGVRMLEELSRSLSLHLFL